MTAPGSTPGPRVRAPELRGRAWLNAGGCDLSLADLRDPGRSRRLPLVLRGLDT